MIFKIACKSLVLLLMISFVSTKMYAQDGVQYYDEDAMDGYALYQSDNIAVLINNCGHIVHEWSEISALYHPKLLPNGNLVYIERFSQNIVEKNWNNEVVYDIKTSNDISPDYEVIVLPNGNYLTVGRMRFSTSDFEEIGYVYGPFSNPRQVDVILEYSRDSGEIVWMWNIADHVIQDENSSKPNFGNIEEHPELLNMAAISTFDWNNTESFMINGFDYNAELDQIVVSIRKMSEIAIIDHSTSTSEAAGHTGGNSGKGGDILYRWGNPQNYGRGTAEDRYLYFQHNPNWIQHGDHQGKLIMYNNGLNRPNINQTGNYSTVPIIAPPIDANGDYILAENEPFEPNIPTEDYSTVTTGNSFYSGYTSGAKVLANNNILITVGGSDFAFEIKPDATVVWEYGLYDTPLTFRMEKYASSYPAFAGKDLTPGPTVEFPESDVPCTLVYVEDTYFDQTNVWSNNAKLNIDTNIAIPLMMEMYSTDGKLVKTHLCTGDTSLDISNFAPGLYFVSLVDNENKSKKSYEIYR